jgi:hypothetical protein
MNELTEALFGIYTKAGAQVTYKTEDGRVRPYWANRYRQFLQRAVEQDDVIGFVERLIMSDEPSRGFGYLKAADRLDLTVEAVILKDFSDLFSDDVLEAARDRLEAAGYQGAKSATVETPAAPTGLAGTTIPVEITFGADGSISARLA